MDYIYVVCGTFNAAAVRLIQLVLIKERPSPRSLGILMFHIVRPEWSLMRFVPWLAPRRSAQNSFRLNNYQSFCNLLLFWCHKQSAKNCAQDLAKLMIINNRQFITRSFMGSAPHSLAKLLSWAPLFHVKEPQHTL